MIGAMGVASSTQCEQIRRECRSLALFIGIYWALRIAVDFFYYDHKD